MNNGKKWIVIDAILGVLGSLAAIGSIFTSLKAGEAEDEERYKELETRYGLTPVNEEEAE